MVPCLVGPEFRCTWHCPGPNRWSRGFGRLWGEHRL